jgi:hypothetical protein
MVKAEGDTLIYCTKLYLKLILVLKFTVEF